MIIIFVILLVSFLIFIYITHIMIDAEIINFLIKDNDEYCSSMSKPDIRARKSIDYKDYIKRVVKEQRASNKELNIKDYIILLLACIRVDLYFYNLDHELIPKDNYIHKILWKFAFIKSNSYENKYPHTREDIIFIHIDLLKSIYTIEKYYDFVGLLIHEKLHIYQRYNNISVDKVLSKNNIERKHLRKYFRLVRANPDLNDWIYSDKNGKLMMSIYNSPYPSGINDVINKAEYEHPYEMISYIIENKYRDGN